MVGRRWSADGSRLLVALLAVATLLAACHGSPNGGERAAEAGPGTAGSVASPGRPACGPGSDPAEPPLRALAARAGLLVGTAVDDVALTSDEAYRACVVTQFSAVTTENVLKFDHVHPTPGRYDFAAADRLADLALAHGLAVRGHALLWHRRIPAWAAAAADRDTALGILREHVATVVGHLRGRVRQWDVVNEALTESGALRASPWLDAIGPDYIAEAFRAAREADPDAELYYNDYATTPAKAEAIAAFVSRLRRDDVPIDGVGLQLHLAADTDVALVDAMLGRLAATGLAIAVTELDVAVPVPASDDALAAQAAVVVGTVRSCRALPACGTLVLWGFTDRHHWLSPAGASAGSPAGAAGPASPGPAGAAAVLDARLRAKPAWAALRAALALPPPPT